MRVAAWRSSLFSISGPVLALTRGDDAVYRSISKVDPILTLFWEIVDLIEVLEAAIRGAVLM